MQHVYHMAILLAFMIFLPGCFDYQLRLDLKADGSGSVSCTLQTPAEYAVNWDTPLAQRIFSPDRSASEPYTDGQTLYLEEQINFSHLGEARLSRISWAMTIVETGILGMTDYTYRITTTLMGEEGIAPEYGRRPSGFKRHPAEAMPWERGSAREQARVLRAQAAEDHSITIEQSLPGPVVEAETIKLGDFLVEPQIEGNRVSWEIPLAQLILHDIRGSLHFSADFRASYEPHINFRPAWATRPH